MQVEPILLGTLAVAGLGSFVGLCLAVRRWAERRLERLHAQDALIPGRLWCRGAFGMLTSDTADYAHFDSSAVYAMLVSDWEIHKQPDLEHTINGLAEAEEGAWDLVRAMLLARAAAAVGWWKPQTSWQRCYQLGQQLQSLYPDWQTMADDLLRARQQWSGGQGMQRVRDQIVQMRNQIWHRAPWNTRLGE